MMQARLPSPKIDINADVGEDADALTRDEAIAACVTTINVACGGHAGDEATMRHMLEVAGRLGLHVAAHPSYPDRVSFGRVAMAMTPEALADSVADQVGALARVASSLDVTITRIKAHGALYHAANTDPRVCDAIATGVDRVLPGVAFVAQAGLGAAAHWRSQGRVVVDEAFADRRYERDGTLVARAHAEAVLANPGDVADQALRIATGRPIITRDGTPLTIRADTICIHADSPNALANARSIAAMRATL